MSLHNMSILHKNLNYFFKFFYIFFEIILVLLKKIVTIYMPSFLTTFSAHIIISFMADNFEMSSCIVTDVW